MFAILSQPMTLVAAAVGALPTASTTAESVANLRSLTRDELRQIRRERDAFLARSA